MSDYKAAISKSSDGSFYALVVRVDNDGEEFVCRYPAGRHFKTEGGAKRFTAKHIALMA